MKTMKKPAATIKSKMDTLVEDARDLFNATAEVAGEKVAEARKRLSTVLESAEGTHGRVREKTVVHEGDKAADENGRVHHYHAYTAIGVGVGVGALVAYLLGRRNGD